MAGELKNGDMPASDLTKREHFAGLALQGLLAGNYSYFDGNANIPVLKETVAHAIFFADELLKQLQETDK